MTDLQGTTPADTFKDLFRLINAGVGLDSTLRRVTGGDGTGTTIYVSTTQVQADMNDGVLRRPLLRDSRSLHSNLGSVSVIESPVGTLSIDLTLAETFQINLDTNITTLDIQNEPPGVDSTDGRFKEVLLIVKQTEAGGTADITWPTGSLWAGGTGPTVTQTLNATDIFKITYVDDGSSPYWFGEVVAQNLSAI